jgi:hypothetical protein
MMYFYYASSVIDAFGLSFPRIGSLRWTCMCSIKMYSSASGSLHILHFQREDGGDDGKLSDIDYIEFISSLTF